ncbi:SGNH/GDSL hydrolase family protein [Lachnospiraceae bacterium NSJ-143]|nr:SGNH/GDSL hydrolase family protein [Lachnospiraceae bacterium NSJ-143]
MKMKVLSAAFILSAAFTINAYAGFSVEGALNTSRPNTAYNINPYNISTIRGVGEGNMFALYTPDGVVEVPLDYPLYRLSAGYTDRIMCSDGKWGIERNVGIKVFDGSEDWKLYTKAAFKNDNTTIFQCSFGENPPHIINGYSTHFDMHNFNSIKTTRYDGISFGETTSTILMRIMNVRNIKDVDTLKTYLKTQYENGTPVKLLYCLDKPVFTEFDEATQKKLSSVEPSKAGYIDKYVLGIKYDSKAKADSRYFVSEDSGDSEMNSFLSVVRNVKVFNSDVDKKLFVSGIYPESSGIKFTVSDTEGNTYNSFLSYAKADFIVEKQTELEFVSDSEDCPEIIKMYVALNYYKIPDSKTEGFSYESTGIKADCIAEKEIVVPEEIYAITGTTVDFNNALLNCGMDLGDTLTVMDFMGETVAEDGRLKLDSENESPYTAYGVYLNKDIDRSKVYKNVKIKFSDAKDNILSHKKIMFLGDSLINENLYPEYFTEITENEGMELIGTRGEEGSRHEGRGGWAAYDYCNTESKYGYSNPFLNSNRKFDFKYYMENNGYESVDYVVINLGINDLNLAGHNSSDEILANLDTIIKSIKAFDSNTRVVLNAPLMLFDSSSTKTAKNDRLELAKSLSSHYYGLEEDGIYVSPVYMNIDSFGDFKFILNQIDEYNQDSSMKVTDTTHPNNGGYEALAKATYAFLQHLEEDY